MAISNKKRIQVRDAIGATSIAILKEFAPETLEHAPESWNPDNKIIFDLVTAFEIKACAAADKALTS